MYEVKSYKGWSWIAWYIIIVSIATIALLSSCRSKQHMQSSIDIEQVEIGETQDVVTSKSDFSLSRWFAMLADSIELRLHADSVVMPDGSKLFSPTIEANATNPQMQSGEKLNKEQSDSSTTQSSNGKKSSSSLTQNKQTEMNVPSPFDWSWLICLAIVTFVSLSLWRWWKGR